MPPGFNEVGLLRVFYILYGLEGLSVLLLLPKMLFSLQLRTIAFRGELVLRVSPRTSLGIWASNPTRQTPYYRGIWTVQRIVCMKAISLHGLYGSLLAAANQNTKPWLTPGNRL